jgi:hypothetical protein
MFQFGINIDTPNCNDYRIIYAELKNPFFSSHFFCKKDLEIISCTT